LVPEPKDELAKIEVGNVVGIIGFKSFLAKTILLAPFPGVKVIVTLVVDGFKLIELALNPGAGGAGKTKLLLNTANVLAPFPELATLPFVTKPNALQ
jgi:hypothetical protein